MDQDKFQLDRTAQRLIVEAKSGSGSPPTYGADWQPVYAAKVEVIEHNISQPHTAVIWFPDLRWHQSTGLYFGDRIRIKTADDVVVFSGFYTRNDTGFFGGDDDGQKAWERNALYCQSHLWLLSTISPVTGQLARALTDYAFYDQESNLPGIGAYTTFTGRRCIFNQDGKPNCDTHLLTILDDLDITIGHMPLFADPDHQVNWTAADILSYLLSPINNKAYTYLPITDTSALLGTNHTDWSQVVNHLVAEGLSTLDALGRLCQRLGWDFREDYDTDGNPAIVFFRMGSASGYTRTTARAEDVTDQTTILHQLHAPAVGESIDVPVAAGAKMLTSADLVQDITPVVNTPIVLGGIHRFEFTAELVPAWQDPRLEPDTTTPYLSEAELQLETDPNQYTFYKYYHPRGTELRPVVGRRWALNESGRYTLSTKWDRGDPFDFTAVLPLERILTDKGEYLFGPFNRRLLPCLTTNQDSFNSTGNSVGIKIEFSFDAGDTWQVIPCTISSLPDECGIYIDQANLAEIAPETESTISGGDLDGVQLNYWTSLCDDKLNSRIFKDGDWKTRVRVTASVQMDRRLYKWPEPSNTSGSPFKQTRIYDFSDKYELNQRAESSVFHDSDLSADETDSADVFNQEIDRLRRANEDASISGRYTLDRMWLNDDNGYPDFAVGDALEKINGREISLRSSFGSGVVYPEIVKIIYYPEKQQQKLITRDLRFAEMSI